MRLEETFGQSHDSVMVECKYVLTCGEPNGAGSDVLVWNLGWIHQVSKGAT